MADAVWVRGETAFAVVKGRFWANGAQSSSKNAGSRSCGGRNGGGSNARVTGAVPSQKAPDDVVLPSHGEKKG
jgi:hypothetical protein